MIVEFFRRENALRTKARQRSDQTTLDGMEWHGTGWDETHVLLRSHFFFLVSKIDSRLHV